MGQEMVVRPYSFAEGLPQIGFRFCHPVSKLIMYRRCYLTSTNARSPSCRCGEHPYVIILNATYVYVSAGPYLLARLAPRMG